MDQTTIVSEPPDAMPLPALIPKFGQTGNFWKRYDELADQKYKEMSKNLNTNLDVLLIFAALFSAVDSTFIGFTMPSLSSDPFERTNALLERIILGANGPVPAATPPFSPTTVSIAINCLVYSSLCFSLFAAVGAMQAKEWLQSYDRTGQAGPLEHQARLRQRKFNGAQQWHLETVILVLPYLLLLSVLLFFAGIALFLFSVNRQVAWVVIAISGLGVGFSTSTIILGAISPLCPYQTASSRGLRRAFKWIKTFWTHFKTEFNLQRIAANETVEKVTAFCRQEWSEAFPPRNPSMATAPHGSRLTSRIGRHIERIRTGWTKVSNQLNSAIRCWNDVLPRHSSTVRRKKSKPQRDLLHEESILDAEAAGWFLEATADNQDQVVLAGNICSLSSVGCDTLLFRSGTWQRLSSLTLEAIQAWREHPGPEKRTVAEQFGAALGHLLLQYPDDDDTWTRIQETLPTELFSSRDGQAHLTHLHYVLTKKFSSHRAAKHVGDSLKPVFLGALIQRGSLIQWNDLRTLVTISTDDLVLAMSAFVIHTQYPSSEASPLPSLNKDFLRKLRDETKSHSQMEERLTKDLLGALASGVNVVRSGTVSSAENQVEFLQVYRAFVLRMRDLVSQNKIDDNQRKGLWSALAMLLKAIHLDRAIASAFSTQLSIEIFSLLQVLYPDPGEVEWTDEHCDGLWIAFSCTIEYGHSSDSIKITETSLVGAFQWYLQSLSIAGSIITRIVEHPDVLEYIRLGPHSKFNHEAPVNQDPAVVGFLWELISRTLCEVEEGLGSHHMWLEFGPIDSVITWFRESQTWTELNRSAMILERIASGSPTRAERFASSGFGEAVADVIQRAKGSSDYFDGQKGQAQLAVLELVIWMWNEGEGLAESSWMTDHLLSGLSSPLITIAGVMDAQEVTNMVDSEDPCQDLVIQNPRWYLKETRINYRVLSDFLDDAKTRRPGVSKLPTDFELALTRLDASFESILGRQSNFRLRCLRSRSWCIHDDLL